MIREAATGNWIATGVEPVDATDLGSLRRGWRFDWSAEVRKAEVFKLVVPASPAMIHGLIALARRQDHVEVTLLESNPENVGRQKRFEGVAGSLLAFAVRFSLTLQFDGRLSLIAKTELIEAYLSYGFTRVGSSNRMNLEPPATAKLIAKYERRQPNG